MRLWPQKRWKKVVLSVFMSLLLIAIILLAYVALMINRDVVSGIDVINGSGMKSALLVYQPGLTNFPRDVAYAFANGLASSGWRVEVTTASSQAPSNLSKYGLLVVGFPIYGGAPGKAAVRYIDRIGNLEGINTVVIAVGAGSPGDSIATMQQKIEADNGTFSTSLTLFSMAPNQGNGTATDIAKEAGAKIIP